jgi:thiamine kinase-like enzyme
MKKSCGTPTIDKNYAAQVAQKALTLQGPITVTVLKGGISGAPLFKVTADAQKYVIRFLNHKPLEKRRDEIANFTIASTAKYGPHLYYANADEGVVIMEYLAQQKITNEQKKSGELCIALAHLLQKIHHGPAYTKTKDTFAGIQKSINFIKTIIAAEHITDFPVEQIETIIATLRTACAASTLIAPCHNDLNPSNIIFLGHEYKAIDFSSAGQANPYYDIATIADPASEHLLLTTYLEREPSAQEQALLYAMKQVVLLSSGLGFIRRAPEKISDYATLQTRSWANLQKDFDDGKISLEEPETKILFGKSMINAIITNSQSQEFRDAVKLVEGGAK